MHVLAILLLLGALGFLGYHLAHPKPQDDSTEEISASNAGTDQSSTTTAAALPVKVTSARLGDLPSRLPISALTAAWEQCVVKAEVDGKLLSVRCPAGSRVEKGEIMALIDDEEIRLERDRLQAEKLKALSNYLVKEQEDLKVQLSPEQRKLSEELNQAFQKNLEAFEKGSIGQEAFLARREKLEREMVVSGLRRDEIRKAQEGLTGATIALRQMELKLERCKVRAPFPGIVSDVLISPGQHMGAGTDLLRLVNPASVHVRGYALETEASQLREHVPVRIQLDAYPGRFFEGEVTAIAPEVDTEKKTVTVFARFQKIEVPVRPGMHGRLDVVTEVHPNVLIVPRSAVLFRDERPLVFKVNDGTAEWVYVQLGPKNDEEQAIISDQIQPGDTIITEGHLTLAHQSRVSVQP